MDVIVTIEQRSEQNYIAIKSKLKREEIPQLLPPLIPELFNWLTKRNIEPAGCSVFQLRKNG